jgi:chromosome partitioning protein
MRSIAFLSQKGGVGRTTMAASLAVAAAGAGERVIALDVDPQASLVSWGERRRATNTPNKLVIEPLESERLPLLHAILAGFAEVGFTIAVFDTAANSTTARLVALAADLCLLPMRPTRLDADVTAATFRAACLAERKAALLLNQCPPTYPSLRISEATKALTRFGVLAAPMLCARMDFQDAVATGLGVTEYARDGKAALEIEALWGWMRAQLDGTQSETAIDKQQAGMVAA